TPYDPNEQDLNNTFASPSWSHWLGTDPLGRDLLSRVIAGGRVSLGVALSVVAIALAVAIPLGLVSGDIGRWVDNVLMRVVDAGLSVPPLVLALALAAALRPSAGTTIVALSIVYTPTVTRLVRGESLAVRSETFIEASELAGTST